MAFGIAGQVAAIASMNAENTRDRVRENQYTDDEEVDVDYHAERD